MISAKIVADSISPQKHRITTFVVTFPRFILAELNTHRMFSRNSASSRAIPFKKMIESIESNPFIPIAWQKDHSGMQGTEYLPEGDAFHCREAHLVARDHAVYQAKLQNERYGVTKQICNRYLEPYMWHTVIITATEFENFFALRCPDYIYNVGIDRDEHYRSKKDMIIEFPSLALADNMYWFTHNSGQAEIHMMALAEAMWDAYNESVPIELKAGDWHIPFKDDIYFSSEAYAKFAIKQEGNWQEIAIKIATTYCARISYTVVGEEISKGIVCPICNGRGQTQQTDIDFDTCRNCNGSGNIIITKEPNYENDIKLHDRLLASGHMSPFEHCAKVPTDNEWKLLQRRTEGYSANFLGWLQYRKMIPNENRT